MMTLIPIGLSAVKFNATYIMMEVFISSRDVPVLRVSGFESNSAAKSGCMTDG